MSRRTSSPYVLRGSVNGRPLAVEIGTDFDPGYPSPPCRRCGHPEAAHHDDGRLYACDGHFTVATGARVPCICDRYMTPNRGAS